MIMDDDRIMKAAQLIANSSAALIQAIGMMSENIERANRGGISGLYRRSVYETNSR